MEIIVYRKLIAHNLKTQQLFAKPDIYVYFQTKYKNGYSDPLNLIVRGFFSIFPCFFPLFFISGR